MPVPNLTRSRRARTRLTTRCEFAVRTSQPLLDHNHLTRIVAFDRMTEKLQHITADKTRQHPPPRLAPKSQHNRDDKGQWHARKMQQAVQRMSVPLDVIEKKSHERRS